MIDKLSLYFAYPFVRYCVMVGVMIALCSSLLGVTLVLKRYSFIGDGLSHVAFGVMSIAAVLNLSNNMIIVLPGTILAAVLLLKTGQNAKIKGDAAIAMISVGALAFGYLIMNKFSTSSNLSGDVCSTLFGSMSILTLTKKEVIICAVLSVIVVVVFILFYNKIFAVTFDETFARSVGTKADAYNFLIAVIIAVIIVLAMNLVGSLLISALVIFPALSSMRIFKTFKSVTIFSAILSVVCAFLGMIISMLIGTPVGSTIVATDIVGFGICSLIGTIKGGQIMKKKIAIILAVSLVMMTGCGSDNGSHDVTSSSGSSVEDVLAQRMAEADAQAQEAYESQDDLSEVPGLSDSEDAGRQSGVDEGAPEPEPLALDESVLQTEGVDIDLTVLSSVMVYSQVYNLLVDPYSYIGKTVKMTGMYACTDMTQCTEFYCACIIEDATQCCSQGIEFELDDTYSFPDDYPEYGDNITVIGEFDIYQDGGYTYCTLRNAKLVE